MDRIVPMLTTYSNLFGQYPFVNEKYGIVQFNWGGGMEHQTLTSQVELQREPERARARPLLVGQQHHLRDLARHRPERGLRDVLRGALGRVQAGRRRRAPTSARMNSNKPSSPTTTGSVYVVNRRRVGELDLQHHERLPEGRLGAAPAPPRRRRHDVLPDPPGLPDGVPVLERDVAGLHRERLGHLRPGPHVARSTSA